MQKKIRLECISCVTKIFSKPQAFPQVPKEEASFKYRHFTKINEKKINLASVFLLHVSEYGDEKLLCEQN